MFNIQILQALLNAASTNDTRHYLRGVHVKYVEQDGSDCVRYSATDGHVLAQVQVEIKDQSLAEARSIQALKRNPDGVILSKDFIRKLPKPSKTTKHDNKHIFMLSSSEIDCPALECTFREKGFAINGTFPNAEACVPKPENNKALERVMIDSNIYYRLSNALHSAAAVLGRPQKHRGLVMTFQDAFQPIKVNIEGLEDDKSSTWVRGVLMGMRMGK